jgi:hypothetical protein
VSETVRFERAHNIVINAPASDILDYVTNPNSWPEWIAASHRIESPDKPLGIGETFSERWHTRTGEVVLDWVVTARAHPTSWTGETDTTFIGKIVVRYDIEEADGGCLFTRTVINPVRPKPPTEDMIRRVDEEAEISLRNIKENVEKRAG